MKQTNPQEFILAVKPTLRYLSKICYKFQSAPFKWNNRIGLIKHSDKYLVAFRFGVLINLFISIAQFATLADSNSNISEKAQGVAFIFIFLLSIFFRWDLGIDKGPMLIINSYLKEAHSKTGNNFFSFYYYV